MAEQQTPFNPFEGILTTQALQQRQAQQAIASAGDNQSLAQMNLAMLQIRNGLMQHGKLQPTPEMQRAARNDQIIQSASQRYAEDVNNGRVDPRDAVGKMMEDALGQFLAAGDAESAAMLAPHIFKQRQENEELAKLKAGTVLAGDQAALARSAAAENEADAELARAHADLYRRTDPNLRAERGGAGGKPLTTPTGFTKFRQQGASVRGLISQLGDLYELYTRAPGIASKPAEVISVIQEGVKGAKALFFSDPGRTSADTDNEATIIKANDGRIQQLAKSLNVDRGALESTIVDTAYTLARARDPGGRISNADFDNALKLLGAAQDPQRAKAVLVDIARRSQRDFMYQAEANPDFAGEEVVDQVSSEWDDFINHAAGNPRKNGVEQKAAEKEAEKAKTKKIEEMTDEELEALANGG